jgi:hypothetical protein
MKRLVLVGTVVGAFTAAPAFLGAEAQSAKAAAQANSQAGHTAPKTQPPTETAPAAPTGEVALGSVSVPKGVKADGKPLSAGTYQLRLTAQAASPDAKGQTTGLERWVEFVQGGQVKGREIATIIPQSQIDKVQKDAAPRPNGSRVDLLKGGDFYRVWINRGGNHYLIHLPAA